MAIRGFADRYGKSDDPADARQYPKQLAERQARQAAAKRSSVAMDISNTFAARARDAQQEASGTYGKFRGKHFAPLRTIPGMRDANSRLPDDQAGYEVMLEALKAT